VYNVTVKLNRTVLQMINMYCFTYKGAIDKHLHEGYILVKIGDSHRDVDIRMNEQGTSAEYEAMIKVGRWNNLKKIDRDYRVHEVLTKRGLHSTAGKGTEWFKIPAANLTEVFHYIDKVISALEGTKVRASVKLRSMQKRVLTQTNSIISKRFKQGHHSASIVANLCPRFGKTIWALEQFNQLTEKYGNKVMLLPAYWLSVHTSFIDELDRYREFNDICHIDIDSPDAAHDAMAALAQGQRIIVPISLHGDVVSWIKKHEWIRTFVPLGTIFNFADEGDFGTHTDSQVEKLDYLFDRPDETPSGMFVSVYASGTNIQRLAKCAKRIDGVVYTAYSELEKTTPGIIHRKFFCTSIDALKAEVEKLDVVVMPSWTKIWDKPYGNQAFIEKLLQSLVGNDTLRNELNLPSMMDESVDCFMLLVSANKKEMGQIAKIAERAIPDWHVKVLNGDCTTNKKAEDETITEINEARIAKKKGVLIIANQMGSRSYGVSAIQASIIAFDRGSVDATAQKVSRCLTPATKEKPMYDDSVNKTHGAIVDLSFDSNRAENIEKLILEEAIQVQRSGTAGNFTDAVKYVLTSVDMFKMNAYGHPVAVTEEEMFRVFGDNEAMLRVADVSVDVKAAIESGMFDILCNVKSDDKAAKAKKTIVGEGVKNAMTEGGAPKKNGAGKDVDVKQAEKTINAAIQALNMSATSVYFLSECNGESYKECLTLIAKKKFLNAEFTELFGVSAENVITLVDNNVLNGAILDVIVQNSKPKKIDFLF